MAEGSNKLGVAQFCLGFQNELRLHTYLEGVPRIWLRSALLDLNKALSYLMLR